jgi:hypothetical protein
MHLIQRTLILAGFAAALARPGLADAQPPPALLAVIGNTTQLYCKDDTGEIVPMQYASLGSVIRRNQERFGFTMSINATQTEVRFSNTDTDFFISYKTQPYRNLQGEVGLAFLSMHVALDNFDQDIAGTSMCYFTQFGK